MPVSRRALLLFGAPWRGAELQIRAAPQSAGALESVLFRGREYVNRYDSSRLIQSAYSYGGPNDRVRRFSPGAFRVMPDGIEWTSRFAEPAAGPAVFESPVGALPPEFSQYLSYDPARKHIELLSDGPGESKLPIILATESRDAALGVYGGAGATYGRVRYNSKPETKDWNFVQWRCLYRVPAARRGPFKFTTMILLGTVAEVRAVMNRLHAHKPV